MNWKKELKAFFLILYALLPFPGEGLKTYVMRFVHNTRGEDYTAPVTMIIAGIIWVICIPIYVDAVAETNTTGWSFTGSAGAKTLFALMPFIFIAGGVVWIVRKALGKKGD